MLLCQPNQVVGTAALLTGVWGEEYPSSGHGLIATYVYRLRRLLGETPEIEHTRAGYRLRMDVANLDTARFAAGVERARAHQVQARLIDARTELGQALSLWRGDPYCGLPGPALAAERARLTEARLSALEQRAELELRCGEGDLGVSELQGLRERFPLRERLAALLMIALYRNGRQAEALAVFRNTDARLREELGVEAGHELTTMHQAILRGDEVTISERAGSAVQAPAVPTPRDDLPTEPPHFTGRSRELAAVVGSPQKGATAVVAIDGSPGIGKTALLRLAAIKLRSAHPAGRFHLDLRGHRVNASPMLPVEALRRLLVAAGHRGEDLPADVDERAALWRATTSAGPVLLVLDDVSCTSQVLPLLPSASGTTVLLASRNKLPALPATRTLPLPPLNADEGEALLARLVGARRVNAERAAARRLVQGCGGSPALLVAVAGRLRHRSIVSFGDLAERSEEPDGLLVLARVEDRDAADLLEPSWSRLCDSQRQNLITLARDGGVSSAEAQPLLDANLVTETASGSLFLPPLVAAFVWRMEREYGRDSAMGRLPTGLSPCLHPFSGRK